MPRKSKGEKQSETHAERPATRRSVRLSVTSPAVTPQQKRAGSSSSSKASGSGTTTSPKSSGKKGAEAKVTTPRTASRGRNKGRKEPEDVEKDTAEQEEQSKCEEASAEQKGKSWQTARKGRGGGAKEKAEVVKTDNEDNISMKELASEEGKELSGATGRPKRGKQSAATPAAIEKPTTTPRRCGRSRGKAATENVAEKCTTECTLEAESSPAGGAKRKRDEADDVDEEEKVELEAEAKSPKKSKTEESSEKEVEKMADETVDEADKKEAEQCKTEKVTDSVVLSEQEEPKPGVSSVPLEAGDKDSVIDSRAEADEKSESEKELLICTSEEPATSDFKENGTASTNEEAASLNLPLSTSGSELIVAKDTTEEASPLQKKEETLSNGTDDSPSSDILLTRKFIWHTGEEPSPSKLAQTFSIVSYNILADFHAQRDYTGPNSWVSKEHLAVDFRHSLLMREVRFLDSDILCLQEVQTDYFTSTLKPALAELGYDGLHVPRHTTDYSEGEATFFRTKCFSLEASQSLILSQVAEREIEESAIEAEVKSSVKAAVDSYAVSLLTRFKRVDSDTTVTCGNIHVAYDKFQRQDKQCLQLACAIRELVKFAGGPDKPHFICGDFNSWPDSPPYQLVQDGHLSEKSLTALQSINSVSQADGQLAPLVNYWSEGFQYSPANNLHSAYLDAVGKEPLTSRFNCDGVVRSVDYIWFSGNSLEVMGVMDTVDANNIKDGVPNAIFPSDHLSLKAVLGFK